MNDQFPVVKITEEREKKIKEKERAIETVKLKHNIVKVSRHYLTITTKKNIGRIRTPKIAVLIKK